jgi:hypothetical protein
MSSTGVTPFMSIRRSWLGVSRLTVITDGIKLIDNLAPLPQASRLKVAIAIVNEE